MKLRAVHGYYHYIIWLILRREHVDLSELRRHGPGAFEKLFYLLRILGMNAVLDRNVRLVLTPNRRIIRIRVDLGIRDRLSEFKNFLGVFFRKIDLGAT